MCSLENFVLDTIDPSPSASPSLSVPDVSDTSLMRDVIEKPSSTTSRINELADNRINRLHVKTNLKEGVHMQAVASPDSLLSDDSPQKAANKRTGADPVLASSTFS